MNVKTLRLSKFHLLAMALLLTSLLAMTVPAEAQGQGPLPQDLIKQVRFDQNLGAQAPLHLTFTDSDGQIVRLGDYFGEKPVILSLGYYECPMLCSLVRNGLFESLRGLDFSVGEEFELIILSIDPGETPDMADVNRRVSITEYGRETSGEGWNFLVGEEENIRELADTVGFGYAYDASIDEYIHPSGIIVLTPDGQVSSYLYGIEYPARDLRLSLVEATANQIGSATDQLLLLCYHYDPVSGEYTFFLMNIIRALGVLTVAIFGGAVFWMMRKERNKNMGTPQSA